uniref:Uncharacterized protein TCIL3000_2_1510 n=1 Tax=Trypanosoma congolense (strain IL3000) TaxID=1068625 RepID=G0UJM0_TRYCI|nr:unnamed protein product [Trypanosoma congolense IL3000]
MENPAEGSLCRIFGYRGTGLLGELDTFDPDLLQRVSSETREQLLESMNCVEGKQEGASTQVEVLSSEGMCRMVTGRCFHGMSGAPLLVDEKTCGGVLYGKHPSGENAIGYVPVRSFVDFVLESLRRESVS